MAKHVAVLMGGWSAERSVSMASGKACASALEEAGYKVTPVDVDRSIANTLSKLAPDVAFNALHGPYGEDGTIQGVLETLQIPYTHSGVLASALAMNKELAKTIMAKAGIPVAPSIIVNRFDAAKSHAMEPPYVLKPVNEGSSYGVLIVPEGAAHPPQELYRDDWPYSDFIMAEQYVDGIELTCAVIADKPGDIIQIEPSVGFYDFDAKYREGGSNHILPAPLKPNVYDSIQKLTLTAHVALGCRGVSRADFRFDNRPDGTGELICLEVNTQPGMTPTSLVPEIAQEAGMSFPELVSWMVEDASCNR